ncbi:MAG: alpha/beta hydrolase [Candidatus Eisenbacteria bacterium]|uniref:Alpha/beta hydrolase n=1 Tax=Eiseniibacteriota bacterium TaxID=2212470 RepID=A0A849SJP4_UNCEI|nr:alpha/beta hydrolase [Candidatus Eisenbacteria bacterium]
MWLIRAAELPPFIAVAIPNSPRRSWEYTPVPDGTREGGGAAAFGRFVIERVKPEIDREYRSLPDSAHTGIVGSSLGGIVSLYLGIEHPETFGMVGCVSPAAWWGGPELVRRTAARARPGLRVWIDIGTREGGPAGWELTRRDAEAVYLALLARDCRENVDACFLVDEGALHDERAWAARVPALLQFLLASQPPASQ